MNTQLGEFTLRRHTMETLPRSIEDHPDFQAIFGLAEDSSRYHRETQSVHIFAARSTLWVLCSLLLFLLSSAVFG